MRTPLQLWMIVVAADRLHSRSTFAIMRNEEIEVISIAHQEAGHDIWGRLFGVYQTRR
jgi:hypothetical protein